MCAICEARPRVCGDGEFEVPDARARLLPERDHDVGEPGAPLERVLRELVPFAQRGGAEHGGPGEPQGADREPPVSQPPARGAEAQEPVRGR